MRVIAGAHRGRKLVAPAGRATRPTADRARETLFSMLHSRIGSFAELRVADLYAGSGALGIEALSRGAAHATFVEEDRSALRAIADNLGDLGIAASASVLARRIPPLPALAAQPYDMIFADPPYGDGHGQAAIAAVVDAGWLAIGGWMALETRDDAPLDPLGLTIEKQRKVGKAHLTLLSKRP